MTQYLLNHFSTLGLIVLVVGGTTAAAVIISTVVHKIFPNLADSGFEEVTGILRADVFALLYTIVLALVIADLSGSLAEASSAVSSEASALDGLTRAADSFPPGPRDSIRDGVDEYVHAVVEDEWPRLRLGEASSRAFAALEGLYASVQDFEPQTQVEQTFYQTSVDDLDQITLSRRERVQQSQAGLSPLLRTLLVVGALVFIILAYPASLKRLRTRVLIVGATSAFVSTPFRSTGIHCRTRALFIRNRILCRHPMHGSAGSCRSRLRSSSSRRRCRRRTWGCVSSARSSRGPRPDRASFLAPCCGCFDLLAGVVSGGAVGVG